MSRGGGRGHVNGLPLLYRSRAVVVHLNFRAGSTFPVPIYTVAHGHWVNKADNQQH